MSNECPKCSEYAEEGKTFCGACGRSLNDKEPDEIESEKNWTEYSPGSQEVKPEKKQPRFLDQIFLAISLIIIFIAVFETIVLVINAPAVLDYLPDMSRPFGPYWMVPRLGAMFILKGVLLQIYWILIVIVTLVCVAFAIYKFIGAIKPSKGTTEPDGENTCFFWIGVLMSAYFLIHFVVALMVPDETVPDFGTKFEQMFRFANAGVWEELASRLLFIGVPMTIISLIITKKKESLKCLLGGFGMSQTAIVLMIISGAIFGLAHIEWGVWKVLPTGVMGVFLGYLFVRFGLYAAILMHFVVDFASAFDWMGVGGLWVYLFLTLIVIGAVAIYYLVRRTTESIPSINALPAFKNDYAEKDKEYL